ncbi:leucine-rich repeat flightless-interacting protein 2 isoform X7 [Latimeria chalumnae]|uniref:leucine-rich repeat flightless-interacting protein 2 isoform X7 n=1 Tax=Latimeria chalumnae TaxID=7897 RepID=UPI0003C12877|nr:PREDICTED: leucine-rich repeat flightless-interacting protein 2 isoform X6 [Latimeria chalumnae]|eukprot:XP_005999603.1 PREDICTED: leucine-rich repeat flightless-interacting protein 2 isoform X6 [Latimeria chalumnae]
MGTPGSGRKRTPIKDRFSAEDEALSHIAREAEARLAAKRAARAEARDIRMRELERQQRERVHHSSDRKWGQIHKWMEDSERAKYSHRSSRHHHLGASDDVMSVRSVSNHRSSTLDVGGSHRSRANHSRRRDLVEKPSKCKQCSTSAEVKDKLRKSSSFSSAYSDSYGTRKSQTSSRKDVLSGFYHDQRNYSSLKYSKPVSTYHTRSSSLYSDPLATTRSYRTTTSSADTGLTRSASLASLCDDGLYNSYSSRTPSDYSFYSSRASSARSSPVSSDDDTASTVSQDCASRGWRDSVSSDFSDHNESAADYFSRSNRRGSIVSDLDDVSIPDLSSLDEKSDKQFETYVRPASRNAVQGLSPATLASLGGTSSRRGSGDTSSVLDPDTSLSELKDIYDLKDQIQDVEGRYMQGLKELKDSLAEVEEKYKKAMVSNAQLDNEKANMMYQVDTLKDVIEEMEEQMAEFYRENEEKSRELERQKHTCSVLQHKLDELKEGIRQRDELIEKHGLVIIPEGTPNGDIDHDPVVGAITVVSQEAAQVLEAAGDGPLDVRLRKLAEEKEELLSQIRKLKFQLEEERQKSTKIESVLTDTERLENGSDLQFIEMQRDANRQISEYKFKLSKAEQDMVTMEQNIVRLEGQVSRYKAASENAEKIEDELKAEKRKFQRELRTALDKIEEMEMTNSHLVKRLEKMKANRSALLSQQ